MRHFLTIIALFLAAIFINCNNGSAVFSNGDNDQQTDDFDFIVLKGSSSDGGNAIVVESSFDAVQNDSLITWDTFNFTISDAYLEFAPQCNADSGEKLVSEMGLFEVNMVGSPQPVLQMHVPRDQSICSVNFNLQKSSAALKAIGTAIDGREIILDTTFEGKFSFYPVRNTFKWDEGNELSLLAVLELDGLISKQVLDSLDQSSKDIIRIDPSHNQAFLSEFRKSVLVNFNLYEDLNKDYRIDQDELHENNLVARAYTEEGPVPDGDEDEELETETSEIMEKEKDSDLENTPEVDEESVEDDAEQHAPSITSSVVLDSMPADPDCWFAPMGKTTFTTSDSTHWIIAASHRYCDTKIDVVTVYSRGPGEEWGSEVAYETDYSSNAGSGSWSRGIPATISAKADHNGTPHIFVPVFSTDNEYGWLAGTYLYREAGEWKNVYNIVNDRQVQVDQGNVSGAPYSQILNTQLIFDETDHLFYLIAHDFAWWQIDYNILYTSFLPNSTTWTPLTPLYTRETDTVNRGAVMGLAQDIHEGYGIQAWVDKFDCSIRGRERIGSSWGTLTINVPLEYAGCDANPGNYYGFNPSTEVIYKDEEPHILIAAQVQGDQASTSLIHLYKTGDEWTKITLPIEWGTGGGYRLSAFLDSNNRIQVLHKDSGGTRIMAYNLESGEDLELYSSGNAIELIDLERYEPKVVTWTERVGESLTLFGGMLSD